MYEYFCDYRDMQGPIETVGTASFKVARVGWRRGVTVVMVIKWRPYIQKWCSW